MEYPPPPPSPPPLARDASLDGHMAHGIGRAAPAAGQRPEALIDHNHSRPAPPLESPHFLRMPILTLDLIMEGNGNNLFVLFSTVSLAGPLFVVEK